MKPPLLKHISDFLGYYRQQQAKIHNTSVRYRISSTLDEYKSTKLIELAFTDKPGDFLPAMGITQIKSMPDIISGMHPVDVNSINDVYYLSCDQIKEVKVCDEAIIAVDSFGNVNSYNLNDSFNPELIKSTRLSYTIGYIQAERLMRNLLKDKPRYKIIRDNISTLYIEELQTGEILLRQPKEILFSKEYRNFSKDDIARIGFICGQLCALSE